MAYSPYSADLWTEFARLVLEASYEATMCATALNMVNCGKNAVFLTLLRGGTFGNPDDGIFSAIEHAVKKFESVDLDVAIVSYGSLKLRVQKLVRNV